MLFNGADVTDSTTGSLRNVPSVAEGLAADQWGKQALELPAGF